MLGTARISFDSRKSARRDTAPTVDRMHFARYCLLYLPNFNVALKSELSEWLGFAGDGSYVNIHQFLEAELVQIALRGEFEQNWRCQR